MDDYGCVAVCRLFFFCLPIFSEAMLVSGRGTTFQLGFVVLKPVFHRGFEDFLTQETLKVRIDPLMLLSL